jgi:hypothetical protein
MKAEEYYNKIRRQLGNQALLSYQIDGCRLYGKDAICKMLEDYHQAKLNLLNIPVVSQQRELLEAYTEQIKEDNEFTEEITFQDINKCIASNCG